MKPLMLGLRLLLACFQRVLHVLTLGHLPPFASVVVVLRQGAKILMIDRVDGKGWGLPGGYVKLHETTSAAARREVREETGLEVELTGILGILSGRRPSSWVATVDVVYSGRVTGGVLRDSREGRSRWVLLDEVRERMAFDYIKILENT